MVKHGTIGWRVRQLRRLADLTQAELGERCGLLDVTISRLEHQEQYTFIQLGTLVPVALQLGVSLDCLVYGSDAFGDRDGNHD